MYQVPGGGATHGTEGPLGVSPGGFSSDLAEQFLQVARTFNPDLAQKPDDADTNDLETINVCTVGALCSTLAYLAEKRNGGRGGSSAFVISCMHLRGH